jgi:photosystem II stability/assembly factor-like uncharacterized protein
MRRASIHFLQYGGIRSVSFTNFILMVVLCLLIFPSATFCATWEPIGPEGGHFIFSMTNPANTNEITAITESPSPSNVYRSNDGGVTWIKISEIPMSYINDISAFNFSTLYAITNSRCFYTTDGGITWSESRLLSSSGRADCICAHPTDSRIVYAAGYSDDNNTYNMVFFKSTDGGQTWNASQFFSFERFCPLDMAISNNNPNVLYIAGRKGHDSDLPALFTTSDGGNTWTDISSAVERNRHIAFRSVVIDPTDDRKVYVGGTYFYQGTKAETDSDLSWIRSPVPHVIYTIGIDPVDPSRIYIGMSEGLAISTNYGLSWSLRNNTVKRKVEHIAIDPVDPSKVYVSSYTGFYKSQNFGSSWEPAHDGIYALSINAMDVDPRMILIQTRGYLMAYGRRRTTIWEDVVTPESCGTVSDILINPDNPNTVIVIEGYG